MDVAIAGGHGQIALHISRVLAQRGDRVRGLIRDEAQSDDLREVGAAPVVLEGGVEAGEQRGQLLPVGRRPVGDERRDALVALLAGPREACAAALGGGEQGGPAVARVGLPLDESIVLARPAAPSGPSTALASTLASLTPMIGGESNTILS